MSIKIKINKDKYETLVKCRDYYDTNIPLTKFCKDIFNATLQHKSKYHTTGTFAQILDRFEMTLILYNEADVEKFKQFIKQDGHHYIMFLLSR